jgi:cytochrome c biogenesis protein CcdA
LLSLFINNIKEWKGLVFLLRVLYIPITKEREGNALLEHPLLLNEVNIPEGGKWQQQKNYLPKFILSLLFAIAWISPIVPQALLMVCFMKYTDEVTSCPWDFIFSSSSVLNTSYY